MQVRAKSFSDTANSRKVSTGGIRPTVPNRSQKEDVLTSSKFLRSGLKSSLAFPIMLAAVGVLLASLVLGVGTNLARALGDGNGGICDYSELMQDAILGNLGLESYECDAPAFTSTAAAPTSDAWGGPDGDNDGAKELDLSDKGLTAFAPGRGELDAFRPGTRVDLRGNGLSAADIDLGEAAKTFDDDTTDYRQFGQSITGVSTVAQAEQVGVTFLLDGGSLTSNGFATAEFEATENGIGWILFEFGDKGDWFVNWGRDTDASDGIEHASTPVVAVLKFDISAQTADFAGASTDRTDSVYAVIESTDPDGTLYAIPYRIADDDEIEEKRSEKNKIAVSIDVTLGGSGTFAEAVAGTKNDAFGDEEFDDSVPRASQSADLIVADED